MVGFHPQDSSNDSDVIGSEEEFECYRAAFNNTASLFCVDSTDGKEVLVSLEDTKPSEKLIEKIGGEKDNHIASKDCWNVDYADSNGHGNVNRYYSPAQMTCYNCDENGHVKYDCPKPKKSQPCLACGLPGHAHRNCSHSLCYNCGYPGHSKRDCNMPIVPSWKVCVRCQAPGHNESQCPDRWRQYHATTTHGPPVQPTVLLSSKPENRPVYCYNCGRQGHWGFDCPEECPDDAFYAGSQLVMRYDSTASALAQLKKRKVKKEKDQLGYSDTVVSDSSAKNPAKKHRNKSHFPRSKSLASEFPVKKTQDEIKRRCKSLDDRHSKESNLVKLKSRSHKSLDKLDKLETKVEKPKKFNKIKDELVKLGVNKNKKKVCELKKNTKSVVTNHVSFKDDKKAKKAEEESYGFNRNKPLPNQNHVNFNVPERTKSKKASKSQDSKQIGQVGLGKKGRKKNKKGNGSQKSAQVVS